MSKLFNKISKQIIKDVKPELIRAHTIIVLLSLMAIGLISLNIAQYNTLMSVTDTSSYVIPISGAICILLISVVLFTSLCTAFALSKIKIKK